MQTLPIVWTALVTPFLDSGQIDFDALARLVDEQIKAANGILFLGSTGEALNLSLNEKIQIIDWVKKAKLTCPTMCGVGGSGLEETCDWIDLINQYPFDCYLMVTPPYAKPGHEGQRQWFATLMDRAEKPCLLYNVPGRTACSLSRKALEGLQKHPRFLGIKESSGSVEEFKAYLQALPNHAVYCGDDIMMPHFDGACGLISVASNAWPSQTHAYAKQCIDKTIQPQDIALWEKAANSLFTASNPVPVKALLAHMGWINSSHVKLPLHQTDFTQNKMILDAHETITTWS